MSAFIIKSAINPPKLPSKIVSRKKLIDSLNENTDKNLILISSPAGWGKTTLIREFIEQASFKCVWLTVPPVKDFHTFTSYLVHTFKQLNDTFGNDTIAISNSLLSNSSDSLEVIHSVVGTFINEICEIFSDDIGLVIDDFHNTDETDWVNQAFKFLFDNIPSNLHIIINTRHEQHLNLTNLSAKRKMFEIKASQLAFDEDEIKEVLKNIYSVNSIDNPYFLKKLDGWITGIHLYLQSNQQGGGKLPEQIYLQNSVHNFFAEEIFLNLGSEVQNFLLNTSLLNYFNPGIVTSVLEVKDSEKFIDNVSSKNIFIQRIQTPDGKSEYYTYHSLFKEYLNGKLYETKPENEIKKILKKAADYFFKINNFPEAAAYSLKAGDFDKAITVILDISEQLIEDASYETIQNWFELIPEDIINNNPYLLFLKSKLVRKYKGDLHKALELSEKSIALFNEKKDLQSLIEAKIFRADILYLVGKIEESFSNLKGIPESHCDFKNKVKLNLSLGRVTYSNGQYNDSEKYLQLSLELSKELNSISVTNNILNLLGSIYQIKGSFIKSLFYRSQIRDINDIYSNLRAMTLSIFLNAYTGEYDKGKEELDKAYDMMKRFPEKHIELSALYADAKFRNEAGDYEGSIISSEKVIKIANETKREYYLYFVYLLLFDNYFKLGLTDAALDFYEECEKYVNQKNEVQVMAYNNISKIFKNKIKPAQDFNKFLEQTLNYYIKNDMNYESAVIKFHLAEYYYENDDTEKCLIYLDDCLEDVSGKRYMSLFRLTIFKNRKLLQFALLKSKYKTFVQENVKIILNNKIFSWYSDECKVRTKKEIQDFYDLNMTAFGELSFKVRGKLIPEEKWTRKISKYILAYLMMYPSKKISKEIIFDLFFPELSSQKAEPLFHNAVTNIRNALSFTDNKINSPPLILYEQKSLMLNPIFYYNSDALQFEQLYKSASLEPDYKKRTEIVSAAISLYNQGFLPGYENIWSNEIREDFSSKYTSLLNLE